jgi:tRNA G18 (ribose-2'-O)-methylase SpoU
MVRKLKNIELNRPDVDEFRKTQKSGIVLMLDNVRSLHNVGSLFRTGDAMKIEKLWLCGITGTPPHREIHKTALGAEASVLWEYTSIALEVAESYKRQGYCIVALEQTDRSLDIREFKNTGQKILIILGNEVSGVSEALLQVCDVILEIPQFGTKHSFNVSVTGAIALWEISRKEI